MDGSDRNPPLSGINGSKKTQRRRMRKKEQAGQIDSLKGMDVMSDRGKQILLDEGKGKAIDSEDEKEKIKEKAVNMYNSYMDQELVSCPLANREWTPFD